MVLCFKENGKNIVSECIKSLFYVLISYVTQKYNE